MRIPISTKLIAPTIAILLGTAITIAFVSSKYFEETSTQREDTSNLESASAKSKEIDNIISSIHEKIKVMAQLYFKSKTTDSAQEAQEFERLFKKDSQLVSLEVIKVTNGNLEVLGRKTKEELLSPFGLDKKYINQMRERQKFPIRLITQGSQSGGIEIKSALFPKGPSIFTIGFPVIKDSEGRVSHIVLADISLNALSKPFTDPSERVQFLIDRQGQLLAHSDENKMTHLENTLKLPIVQRALIQKSPKFQNKFLDPATKKYQFGAIVKTTYGPLIISQISEEIILEPAREVKRKAFFITGISISVAIFVIFLLSMSVTSPIETLAQLIVLVSKGNFDVNARAHVTSQDEVGDLAKAFDEMTGGLKERDKVKNLFNKFHGSSVAEEMINNDIKVGGQNKDVVVFFSDIRGFTAFSEKRSPEEVVEMLNEYFGVMVGIINRNGGVVDKFIGDAIMAVWGAPRTFEKDSFNAVKACLEMRQELASLNEKRIEREQPPIQIGMGLHAGQAISGTIGSEERMEYTVIGNTVNTASRIEASTKAFGADLLITEEVVIKAGDHFAYELAGTAEVKGRTDAIKMFKVKGFKDSTGKIIEIKTPYSDYEAEKADKVKISA